MRDDVEPDAGGPWTAEDQERWDAKVEEAQVAGHALAAGRAPERGADGLAQIQSDPRIRSYPSKDHEEPVLVRRDQLLVGWQAYQDPELRKEIQELSVREIVRKPPSRNQEAYLTQEDVGYVQLKLKDEHDPREVSAQLRDKFARLDTDGAGVPIGPNHVMLPLPQRLYGPADDPATPALPHDLLGLPDAGTGVRVAVLDTGEQAEDVKSHPWLSKHVGTQFASISDDPFVTKGSISDRVGGHGNFVAGRVIEQAPSASIDILSVATVSRPAGTKRGYKGPAFIEEAKVVWALQLAIRSGHDVVTMSFGGPSVDDQAPFALEAALVAHRNDGSRQTAFVASAGNDNTTRPYWPAAYEDVIAVAAVDCNRGEVPFSNRNPENRKERQWVDCCTYGVHVVSSFVSGSPVDNAAMVFDGWATWSGTSFAAPRVAGKIAAAVTPTVDGFTAATQLLSTALPAIAATQSPVGNFGKFIP